MINISVCKWMKGYDKKSYAMKKPIIKLYMVFSSTCFGVSSLRHIDRKESATTSATNDKVVDFQIFGKQSKCSLHTLNDNMHVYGFNMINLQTVRKQFLCSNWSCWYSSLCLLSHGNFRAWLLVQFPCLRYRSFSIKTIKVISVSL